MGKGALMPSPSAPTRSTSRALGAALALALALGVLSACGGDNPPADTGGDGVGAEEDGTTQSSIAGNDDEDQAETDGMNDDPETPEPGDDEFDEATDGGAEGQTTQGGQTGAAGGDG